MTIKKLLITFLMAAIITPIYAQNIGDMLYEQGIEAQKIRNTSSQKKAIELFSKAKVAYQSVDNKSKCDERISECNSNIERYIQISKEKKAKENGDVLLGMGDEAYRNSDFVTALKCYNDAEDTFLSSEDKEKCKEKIGLCEAEINKRIVKEEEPVVVGTKDYIQIFDGDSDITLDAQVHFKNKKNQNVILMIKASREDWTCANDSPAWLSVTKDISATAVSLTVPEKTKMMRSAIVTVTSGTETVRIKVIQDGDMLNKIGIRKK